MPQKTREQKMRAAARKHTPTQSHNSHVTIANETIQKVAFKKTKDEAPITSQEAAEDKLTRRFFLVDFRKSLIITILILAFEVAVKFVQLDQLLARYLKI